MCTSFDAYLPHQYTVLVLMEYWILEFIAIVRVLVVILTDRTDSSRYLFGVLTSVASWKHWQEAT